VNVGEVDQWHGFRNPAASAHTVQDLAGRFDNVNRPSRPLRGNVSVASPESV